MESSFSSLVDIFVYNGKIITMKNTIKLYLFLFVLLAILSFSMLVLAGVSYACNYHAYRDCLASSIYWYDSCGNRQDLYQNCSGANQTCQYGQCVVSNPYVLHSRLSCHSNNLYWSDSNGALQGLYKSCADTNQCTADSCSGAKCSNTIKCDGSTCALGSADYITYCAANHCPNGACESDLGENPNNCPSDCKVNNLSVSFLGKKSAKATQWDKTIQIAPNSNIYFLVNVSNNSNTRADDVNISANIPSEIAYLGNLKVNDVLISGDIVFGVNIGFLEAMTTKSITFEAKTQEFSANSEKQATITISAGGVAQSDTVTVNFNPNQQTAAVSSDDSTVSSFVEFLKRWYLWILAAIVLIFLFIVVFRRFSSNV